MICRLHEKQLSSYLDGELPARRAARMEAHLRVCPRCRGELNAMIGIAEHIREASKGLQVSQDFDQRVLHAVGYLEVTGRQVAKQRSPFRTLLLVSIAALALLGALWQFVLAPPPAAPAAVAEPVAAQVAPAPPAAPVPLPTERRR